MMGRVSIVISLAPAIGPTLAGPSSTRSAGAGSSAIVLPIALRRARRRRALDPQPRRDDARADRRAFGDPLGASASAAWSSASASSAARPRTGRGRGGRGRATLSTIALIVSLAVGVIALGLFVWRQLGCSAGRRAARPAGLPLGELLARRSPDGAPVDGVLRRHHRAAAVPAGRARVSALQTGLIVLPGALVDGPPRSDHRPHLRPLGHPGAAGARHDHRERDAVVLHDLHRPRRSGWSPSSRRCCRSVSRCRSPRCSPRRSRRCSRKFYSYGSAVSERCSRWPAPPASP